jgi:enoyl-CoA hydratase/carnithine racemase
LLTTEALSFEDLAQHLAFDWLVAADDVAAHANELIAKLIGLAPLSMSAMLTIIKAVEEGRFDRAEAQALADQCSSSDDFLEGLRAQKEKRIPVFRSC